MTLTHKWWNRRALRASRIQIAQEVGGGLQFVGTDFVLVVKHHVLGRTRRAHHACVRTQVELKERMMHNATVHHGARLDVLEGRLVTRIMTDRQEARIMTLLDHYVGHFDVGSTEFGARRFDCAQFNANDLLEVALADTVTIDENLVRQRIVVCSAKILQQINYDQFQVDHLLARTLLHHNTLETAVKVSGVRANAGCDRLAQTVRWRWMCNV